MSSVRSVGEPGPSGRGRAKRASMSAELDSQIRASLPASRGLPSGSFGCGGAFIPTSRRVGRGRPPRSHAPRGVKDPQEADVSRSWRPPTFVESGTPGATAAGVGSMRRVPAPGTSRRRPTRRCRPGRSTRHNPAPSSTTRRAAARRPASPPWLARGSRGTAGLPGLPSGSGSRLGHGASGEASRSGGSRRRACSRRRGPVERSERTPRRQEAGPGGPHGQLAHGLPPK